MLQKEQFLAAITTTFASDWKKQIQEIDQLSIKRLALFPTCLEKKERAEMYALLEKTGLEEIPFVHLRHDMDSSELDYLMQKFKTKVFNTHTQRQYPFEHDLSKFKKLIFVENAGFLFEAQELEEFAGICLDFSHLEDKRLLKLDQFKETMDFLKKYPIGCNHISAIESEPHFDEYITDQQFYSRHYFEKLSYFDYLKQYPVEFFSDFVAIEVGNSLTEQLRAIDYIVKLLNN